MRAVIAEPLLGLAAPIDTLTTDPDNANRGDVEAIRRSLNVFGQRKPVVVRRTGQDANGRPTGFVTAGNHTLLAAIELGWDHIAAVFIDDDATTAKAYALADNRTGELSTWDDAQLAQTMRELSAESFDLSSLGWTGDQLYALLNGDTGTEVPLAGLTDPDAAPDVPAAPVSMPGDVWHLGPHRLLCGDLMDLDAVAALMAGEKAACVWTDPPYNADYSSRVDKSRQKPWGGIANDDQTAEAFGSFVLDACASLWCVLADGGSIYLWTDWKRYPQVSAIFAEAFNHKATIVWDKGHFGLGTFYRTQYELQLYGIRGERSTTWNAGHNERDVWTLSRDPVGSYVHPTQKPVELAIRAMSNSSNVGDVVFDGFAGSGSSLIAAHRIGRIARAVELDPRYADVICRRYQEHSGVLPVLASTGVAHDFT